MVDFDNARREAFAYFNSTNATSIINSDEAKTIGKSGYVETWKVVTEIQTFEDPKLLGMYICFPKDFPLVLPEIFLTKESYAEIKYIPHVDHRGFVCIYDSETIKLDASQPAAIVRKCFLEAKRTIEKGLKNLNTIDFDEEFKAYWENEYPSKEVFTNGISLIDYTSEADFGSIGAFTIASGFRNYDLVIHEKNNLSDRFKKYLKELSHETSDIEPCYLGAVQDVYPPFNFTNSLAWEFVKKHFPSQMMRYERYLNRHIGNGIILFSKILKGKRLYFGWKIPSVNTNRNGFRDGSITPAKATQTFAKHQPITRIKFDQYTSLRLTDRTDGPGGTSMSGKVSIAGLGSIGSHILNSLVFSGIRDFVLIDNDTLSIENLNRHILGLPYIKENKADALKTYFQVLDPLMNIEVHETSIISVLRDNPGVLNDSHILIVAIGKENVEDYIVSCRKSSIIRIPILICWVEPFLAGGHYIYINDPESFELSNYMKNGYYIHNLIRSDEYSKHSNKFLLREAGCQASYIPYGRKYVNLFISATIQTVLNLIEVNPVQNTLFSWVGDKELLVRHQIAWNDTLTDNAFGELIFHS